MYSKEKHKQRGTSRGAYTNQFCHIPVLVMLWLGVIISAVTLATHLQAIMAFMSKFIVVAMCIRFCGIVCHQSLDY